MDIEGGHSWWENRRRYDACSAQWRRTPGGRALHAFYDGSEVPLCGVRPVGADGQPIRWRRGSARTQEHGECARLAQQERNRRVRALIEQQREENR